MAGSWATPVNGSHADNHNNGDLNNDTVMRQVVHRGPDEAFSYKTLAIREADDEPSVRTQYRPFLLGSDVSTSDWIAQLELSTAVQMAEADLQRTGERLRIMVLYGSLRHRSYSQLLAYEASRILFRLGCDVRVFDPAGLPVKDDTNHDHPKVQELRSLSRWSDGHVWVSPEQHGNLV